MEQGFVGREQFAGPGIARSTKSADRESGLSQFYGSRIAVRSTG
jgi:hypothetical protein